MNNPNVYILLVAYNQRKFIVEAVRGVLDQDYALPCTIILSDDCSTDDTFDLMRAEAANYDGSNKIILNRNSQNKGLCQHINHLMASFVPCDSIVVLAGGDDISLPCRVSLVVDAFSTAGKDCKAVSGQCICINENGEETGRTSRKTKVWRIDTEYLKSITFMAGVTALSFKSSLWHDFGPFLDGTPTEDSTLRFRALLSGFLLETEDFHIKYRQHSENMSGPKHIHELKTQNISMQYYCDIDKAYADGIIDKATKSKLEKKVFCYKIYRILAFSKTGKSRLLRLPYKVGQILINKYLQWG